MADPRKRRRWGARVRITLVGTIAFAVAATALSIGLLGFLRGQLLDDVDQANARRAQDIASLLNEEVSDAASTLQLPAATGGPDVVQVLDTDGVVLTSSAGLTGRPALPHEPATAVTVEDLVVGNHAGPYRLSAVSQTGPDGRLRTVVVGRSLSHIEGTLDTVTAALVMGVPLLAALVASLTWVAVARSLRPVEAIRLEFSRITGTDLHRRVPHPGTDDELGALADTLNATIEHLERDLGSQQRFVGDAAHELRSPLAALTAQLELTHTGGEGGPVRHDAEATESLLHQSRRLEQLVDDLLVLARHDSPSAARPHPRLVDLDELVLEEVLRVRLTSPVPIDAHGVSSAQVRAEPDSLQRVVRNVLDNATRHARGRVVVTVNEQATAAVLTLDDDGPGIPTEDRDRIFERFTRLDDARDRRRGGSGLGLAISREIMSRHAGRVDVADSPLGGARFTITLPAATPAPEAVPGGI